jgi:hypothetical protein
MLELEFCGDVKLREDYVNSHQTNYYVVLNNGSFKSALRFNPTPVQELAVPIERTAYDSLKKQLEGSRAERPIFRFKVKVPIDLGSISFE